MRACVKRQNSCFSLALEGGANGLTIPIIVDWRVQCVAAEPMIAKVYIVYFEVFAPPFQE
jgi:hypothetical protein